MRQSSATRFPTEAPRALEFFAGIGLARLGLEGAGFRVVWSNDYEPDKQAMYDGNFGESASHQFVLGDVRRVNGQDMPADIALAWASSPCTDLSLAGARAGLRGTESSTFWEYIRILDEMDDSKPPVAVLENVVGLATSHGGEDMAAAVKAFNGLGYSVDVLAIDARRFVPQSRPRLFLVGAQTPPPESRQDRCELRPDWLWRVFSDPTLRTHRAWLPEPPTPLMSGLGLCVETVPLSDERWWDDDRTRSFVESLSPVQRRRVAQLQHASGVSYRTAYRRTRRGTAVWEVRPDDIAGCLRTARGGSSKQAVVRLGNGRLDVRWMTPREYATLMGASHYCLDGARTNQSLFGFGDAVAVPVVEWLAKHYLMPLVSGQWSVEQQLVAAKLTRVMPEGSFTIHGASVADSPTDRGGDFVLNETVVHCTTAPGEPLIQKCAANLKAGARPVIITLFDRVRTALDLATDAGLEGRVEVWDVQQFLATNISERSLFDSRARNIQISDIIDAYNQIIDDAETDPSLRIEFEAR